MYIAAAIDYLTQDIPFSVGRKKYLNMDSEGHLVVYIVLLQASSIFLYRYLIYRFLVTKITYL